MSKNKKIILTAILLALNIVLSRFISIKTPIMKISFAFVPTMLCATWLGVTWTVLLNVLGDLIGATLFPTGPFFIGYTITTAVAGFIYGILLHKKKEDSFTEKQYIIRIIIATVLVAVISNLGLNTLWISITAGKAFIPLLYTRFLKEIISIPVHIIIFYAVERTLRKLFDTYIRSEDD